MHLHGQDRDDTIESSLGKYPSGIGSRKDKGTTRGRLLLNLSKL
jgi:hypothetical protein